MTHPTDALRLVPLKLTPTMIAAARGFNMKNVGVQARWEAMLEAAPASPLPGGLPPISLDGPYTPNRNRQWLARQLLDSKLDDDEAYSIVRHHPAISPSAAPTGDA